MDTTSIVEAKEITAENYFTGMCDSIIIIILQFAMDDFKDCLLIKKVNKQLSACAKIARTHSYLGVRAGGVTDKYISKLSKSFPGLSNMSLYIKYNEYDRRKNCFQSVTPHINLNNFKKFTFLNDLYLHNLKILPNTMTKIFSIPTLEILTLDDCYTSKKNFGFDTAVATTNIVKLSFLKCNLNNYDLKQISQITKLESFAMRDNKVISDKGIKSLYNLKELDHLVLDNCPKLTDNAFSGIKKLKELRYLAVRDCGLVTDTILEKIVLVGKLERISFTNGGMHLDRRSIDYVKGVLSGKIIYRDH